jgi:hypothetical protein
MTYSRASAQLGAAYLNHAFGGMTPIDPLLARHGNEVASEGAQVLGIRGLRNPRQVRPVARIRETELPIF